MKRGVPHIHQSSSTEDCLHHRDMCTHHPGQSSIVVALGQYPPVWRVVAGCYEPALFDAFRCCWSTSVCHLPLLDCAYFGFLRSFLLLILSSSLHLFAKLLTCDMSGRGAEVLFSLSIQSEFAFLAGNSS